MFDATDQAADGTTSGAEGPRIGVFVCHCGGNISDVVDVKRVAEETRRMPGVVFCDDAPVQLL